MTDERDYGVIRLEDGNQPTADYTPARKASVEIGFSYQNPAEAAGKAEQASALAEQQLNRLLGRTPRPTAAAQPAEADKPATRARSKKADPVPPASSDTSGATAGTGGSDPFATESPEIAAERARINAELAAVGQAPLGANAKLELAADPFTVTPNNDPGEDPFTVQPEVKEITDADLNAAVQKKNGELGDPTAIRGLIAKYNPDQTKVFQLREITQAQRQDFLDKLANLKKAA